MRCLSQASRELRWDARYLHLKFLRLMSKLIELMKLYQTSTKPWLARAVQPQVLTKSNSSRSFNRPSTRSLHAYTPVSGHLSTKSARCTTHTSTSLRATTSRNFKETQSRSRSSRHVSHSSKWSIRSLSYRTKARMRRSWLSWRKSWKRIRGWSSKFKGLMRSTKGSRLLLNI